MNRPCRHLFLVIITLFLSTGFPVPPESSGADQNETGESLPDPGHTSKNNYPKRPGDVEQTTTGLTERVEVALDIIPRLEKGKLYFDVTTNLPDGMVFLATIIDDMGIINSVDATLERLHTVIDDGEMMIGPFPAWDGPFPSGEYTLYLNSSPAARQPRSVLSIIGEKGENLNGYYVTRGKILFVKTFMVTGAARSM